MDGDTEKEVLNTFPSAKKLLYSTRQEHVFKEERAPSPRPPTRRTHATIPPLAITTTRTVVERWWYREGEKQEGKKKDRRRKKKQRRKTE